MGIWLHVASPAVAEEVDADLLLSGGTIYDGSGESPITGDVAIRGDRIVAVGQFAAGRVGRTIDCGGLCIAPGFIDLHNHSDESILQEATRGAFNYLSQGCTTLVTGNCGGGNSQVGEYYAQLARAGSGTNIAHLLPQGQLRDDVMGKVRRPPTAEERATMLERTAAAMQEGAWGMSTGLQYVPGSYADLDELAAIAGVVGRHGGIYASHIRDEGDQLLEAVEEAIEIGRRGHVAVHVSHFKASKQRNWGKVRAAAEVIEQARQEGLRVTADQYPYNASSTSFLAMLLPDDEREGGEEATIERLNDPTQLARLRPLIADAVAVRGRLLIASCEKHPQWVGRLLREVAAAEHREPVDVALDLLRGGGAQAVNFGMDENDVRFVMTLPWVATASDGSSKIDDGTRPHPRSFGTFTRKLGLYAIAEQVIPLEAAIRSATGLPADILGCPESRLPPPRAVRRRRDLRPGHDSRCRHLCSAFRSVPWHPVGVRERPRSRRRRQAA